MRIIVVTNRANSQKIEYAFDNWSTHAHGSLAMETHVHIWGILPCCIELETGILNMQKFYHTIYQR